MSDAAIEAALASGGQSGLLEDYFGPAQHAELRRLAQEANVRSVRDTDRVLILPGIMGSKLGYHRDGPFDDVIWVDPIDIAAGRLGELALNGGDRGIGPLGVILFTYLKLKYRLRIAGYHADFHPFDWRRSVVELGQDLANRVDGEHDNRRVHLVVHSMGGLVARAAVRNAPRKLGRIVMLGTPNHGSFSPIQAFRGTHAIVRKIAFIDLAHTQEELARAVFGTFPGLYEMMPSPETFGADYFSLSGWPSKGVLPDDRLLAKGREIQESLTAEYDDLFAIVGDNRETIVSAAIRDDEFEYTTSLRGDGTVPLLSGRLAGAKKTYRIEEEHGSLPNNDLVARAVDSILATGETSHLPEDRPEPRGAAPLRTVRENALTVPPYTGDRGRPLGIREQRVLIREFAAPEPAPLASEEPETGAPIGPSHAAEPALSDGIIIGRQRQHRLDITLVFGSITEVDAGAYVLGMFRNVAPGGPAEIVDGLLGGAIAQLLARRMFNANVGEISILPTGRHPLRANVVAFAGLGPFDSFQEEVLEIVADNLVRTFVATRIDDFATVLVSSASGMLTVAALRHLLTGFLRGLVDADRDQHFRGITICETDPGRFAALRREMFQLCGTSLFDGIDVTLRVRELPVLPAPAVLRAPTVGGPESVYLIVRQETRDDEDPIGLTASVLTAGANAAIYKGRQEIDKAELDELLRFIETDDFKANAMPDFGGRLARLVVPESVRSILERYEDHPLVIVHDAGPSRIPWEIVRIGDLFPAIAGGLSHLYEAEDLAIAKWPEQRQHESTLDVLLVVNPTRDLPGADEEGRRIETLFEQLGPAVHIEQLKGDQARKQELLRCFSSGKFDIVHYAGHAGFDRYNPARSGIRCANGEMLSGTDLASVGNLPSLMFFNACEAARVRKRNEERADPSSSISERVRRTVGFAEAFLRGGVANYVGTYWPVGDAAALAFAKSFYQALLAGSTLGDALITGRKEVYGAGSVDWADYILYGYPGFRLKQRGQ